MRTVLLTAVLLGAAAPLTAQTTALAHSGQTLYDTAAHRIATIDSVSKDGSVRVIIDDRFATVPGNTVTIVNGKPVTSLSKHDVEHLN